MNMNLTLHLRTQIQPFKGSDTWEEATVNHQVAPEETAIIICDVWDRHWCRSATRRCDAIAHRMAPVIEAARERGIFIIHAPSECMEFYRDTPQRKRMAEAPAVEPPAPLAIQEPPLPIDDSDGGCDDDPPCPQGPPWPWTHQNPTLRIAEPDGISDKGAEVYSALRQRGIRNLLIMGVHTNMCVTRS